MATASQVLSPAPPTARTGRPVSSVRFDGMVIAVCCWLIGGVFLDTWAHSNLAILDTFFTPWHAVLYSGGAAVTAALFGPLLWYRRRGYAWTAAMPAGYELSLLGAVLFALGGLGDMTWHVLFGIERNIDAILSPTHLELAVAIGLIVSGPLRAAWLRPDSLTPPGWAARLPMLISLGFTLTMTTLLTMYANPFSHRIVSDPGQTQQGQSLAVAGLLFYTLLLMGFVLVVTRRWPALPFGSLTVALALGAVMLGALQVPLLFLGVFLLTGLAADAGRVWLRPSAQRVGAWRLYAAGLPALLYALYFLAAYLTAGIYWSIHMWMGCVVLAAIAGWLLSFVAVAPAHSGEGR